MLRYSPFLVVLIWGLASQFSNAQTLLEGSCPNVTLQEDFNILKYMGKWYEIERSFAIFQLGLKCVTAQYSILEADVVTIVNKGINKKGEVSSIEGQGRLPIKNKPALLTVTLEGGVPFGVPYMVMSTDYENYAIVFSCFNLDVAHTENTWILSRKPSLSEEKIAELKQIIKKNGIDPKSLNPTAQSCPEEEKKDAKKET